MSVLTVIIFIVIQAFSHLNGFGYGTVSKSRTCRKELAQEGLAIKLRRASGKLLDLPFLFSV